MLRKLVDRDTVERIRRVGISREKPFYYSKLVSMFKEQADVLLEEVSQAIVFRDSKKLQHCAHRLRGSADSIGAMSFAESCFELQSLAELPNLDYDVAKETHLEIMRIYEETKCHLDREVSN